MNNRCLLTCFVSILCVKVAYPFSMDANAGNGKDKYISAAQKARREEERRRKERLSEVVPGKTSAMPGAKDFEINVKRTELEWGMQASGFERQVKEYTQKGLESLRMFRLEEADKAFDAVYELKPNAYCWQAGIVKFYLGDYINAADCFARNAHYFESKFGQVASEERIWRGACELKMISEMRKKNDKLDPPPSQIEEKDVMSMKETRKVIRIAEELFTASTENDLSTVTLTRAKLRSICGEYDGSSKEISNVNAKNDKKMWRLNSWYYLGLHYDVMGDATSSKDCMKMALRQCVSGNGNDIIQTLPMLHMARRDWFDDDEFEEDDGYDPDEDGDDWNVFVSSDGNAIRSQSIKESVGKMKLSELQDSLKRRGIKSSGSKSALKERLIQCLLQDGGSD